MSRLHIRTLAAPTAATRLLIAVLVAWNALSATAQQLTDRYKAGRPVVIACDWDKPPYEFLDDQGQPAGSNVDVLRVIMKELGVPCQFVMKEWGNAIKTFERGDADLILANINRFRGDSYVATQIINYNRVRVAMTKDTTDIISLKTLEQEGVVLKTGDYSAMYFKDTDSTRHINIEFQSPKVALQGLLAGDCKYFVWGEEPLKWKLKELNMTGIYLNEVSIPVSEVHIIGRDKELIDQIDDHYSRMKQSGELELMLDKWFHPERVHQKTTPTLLLGILAALLLGVIAFVFNRLARKHVRKASRDLLEQNEMMYRALHMGNFNVMLYDIANDRMTNRYGHILPDKGLTLEEFTERIHPDQQQEFELKMRRLMANREHAFELDKRWNAGTVEEPDWLNFHGHAIVEQDQSGRPAYIVNALHDVTKDVEEDKVAHELVNKYERLLNAPSVAMSFYSKDGQLLMMNDAMRFLCGVQQGGNDVDRYWRNLNMFDAPLFRNTVALRPGEVAQMCQHMYYPEVNVDHYIEVQTLPLCDADGVVTNYFVILLDKSGDRHLDHTIHLLARQDREKNELIEQRKQLLDYLLRISERYLMRSDMRERRIAFYRSQGAPEYVYDFDTFIDEMLPAEERESFENIICDTETHEPRTYVIHLLQKLENQLGTVFNITLTPVYDEEGNIIGHEGIASDITRLITTRRQLVNEMEQAENSVRQKSGFMASMTHELRTPLNAIVGFTGVLEAIDEPAERAEYVRIIHNSCDMLQRLINDIIEASSIEGGPITITPEDINFAAVFEDICLTLQQRVQEPGVTFVKDNPYNSFLTTLDKGRVQQVLTNFVTNAVKFTKKGHIRLGYRYENSGLYCYCEDTGLGIPKDKQDVIFGRFVKLDEFVQGTGMGLAISKSIVERCNGKIGVISEGEGKGSTFWFWLPCERRLS